MERSFGMQTELDSAGATRVVCSPVRAFASTPPPPYMVARGASVFLFFFYSKSALQAPWGKDRDMTPDSVTFNSQFTLGKAKSAC